jgi:fumarate reductase (CoM/CoB) subunit B
MCRHCFMCRHANPTFLVTKLDAHTPRGYALSLSRIDDGLATWSEDVVTKLFQSTLDGLCAEVCEFHWREDLVVQAGRAEAVRLGRAPARAIDAAARRQDGVTLPPGSPVAVERLDRVGADVLYLTGIVARERAPQTIAAAATILDGVGGDWTMLSVERDPGLDLWELGYTDAAATAAQRFVTEVRAIRPASIVTGSSRVLRSLRRSIPSSEFDSLPAIEHLSEYLLGRVERHGGGARSRPVAFHDPCALARGAGVVDAPREIIRVVTGFQPVEFLHHAAQAECCGDGGLLPEVDPALSERMADAQLDRLPEGVDTLVTACPGCRSQLGAAAARVASAVEVIDLSELVARKLASG